MPILTGCRLVLAIRWYLWSFHVTRPDHIGYGGSSGASASYLIAEDYAITTFNLRAAAATLVPALQSGGGVGSTLVVAGYSEGGYAALALHRESREDRGT